MTVLAEVRDGLAANGKGHVTTNENIARIKPLLKTNAQAIAALDVAHKFLLQAYEKLDGYNLVDVASGVYRANLSLITNTIGFITRLKARIPNDGNEPSDIDASGVALTLLQAIDCLRTTDLFVRQSQDFSYVDAFFEALGIVLETMLKKVIVPTLKAASSLWVPALAIGGAWLLISAIANKSSR